MHYIEEDYLQIAGIQHFSFCRRQWALIHLEQEWAENVRTVEGQLVHEKAHNDQFIEKRGNTLITRGLEVSSSGLGIYGVCDVVEFHKSPYGVPLVHYDGLWIPMPIEYKRGKAKTIAADRLQVCAQAVCLEEIFHCCIEEGAIYYHEVNQRERLVMDSSLRNQLICVIQEMHEMYHRQYTPKVSINKSCNACSLRNICIPKLNKKLSVDQYIRKYVEEDLCEN